MTSLELRADLTDLPILAEALEAFGAAHGVATSLLSIVHVALAEVVTALADLAAGGTPDASSGPIRIDLEVEGPAILVRVEKGVADAAPLPELDLVTSLMDEVRYGREGGRHVLTIRKTLS